MNDLFRTANTIEKINKYESLGFNRNPFPMDTTVKPNSKDYRVNGSVFYKEIRETEQQEFKQIVIPERNTISLLMDHGTFKGRGIGKTAFLNFMRKAINEDLGNNISDGEKVLYAIYITPDGADRERKWWQITRLIFNAIREDDIISFVFARLRVMSGYISKHTLNEISAENIHETLLKDDWLKEHGMKREDIISMNNCVRNKLKENGIELNLTLNLEYKNTFDDFTEKVFSVDDSDTFWRKKGTEIVFDKLASIFRIAGFSHCILLFDNLEHIIYNQNTAERRDFCDSLRTFFVDGRNYNATEKFFKIFLTIHPNIQQLLIEHWGASGLERFCRLGGELSQSSTVLFRPVEKDEFINPLAQAYLDKARINPEANGIAPFTNEALTFAFNKSDRILGKYFELLYMAIENSAASDIKVIDIKDIENIINPVIAHNKSQLEFEILPQTDTILNED